MIDATILVACAEDGRGLAHVLPLAAYGYTVVPAEAEGAARAARRLEPDAVVLDVTRLETPEAVPLVRAVRAASPAPLLVIVAPRDEQTGLAVLDAGADDFLRQPVAALELQARLRAQLRPRRHWSHQS